jgi:rRNA maturation RNase YbeY
LSGSLFIKNQQRTFPINVRYLRWLTRELLQEFLWIDDFDLAVYLVRAPRMAQINEKFLHHQGPTDVITLDYGADEFRAARSESAARSKQPASKIAIRAVPAAIRGELFVCVDEAMDNAREFHTTWESEVIRYVIHGILHLQGHDDRRPAARQKMKREEDRLLKKIVERYPPKKLSGKQER